MSHLDPEVKVIYDGSNIKRLRIERKRDVLLIFFIDDYGDQHSFRYSLDKDLDKLEKEVKKMIQKAYEDGLTDMFCEFAEKKEKK